MAKMSLKQKQLREPKYSTRAYNRCKICGRPHAYMRKFGICRISALRSQAGKQIASAKIPRRTGFSDVRLCIDKALDCAKYASTTNGLFADGIRNGSALGGK